MFWGAGRTHLPRFCNKPTSHFKLFVFPIKPPIYPPCFLFSADFFALHFTEEKRIIKWQQPHPPWVSGIWKTRAFAHLFPTLLLSQWRMYSPIYKAFHLFPGSHPLKNCTSEVSAPQLWLQESPAELFKNPKAPDKLPQNVWVG